MNRLVVLDPMASFRRGGRGRAGGRSGSSPNARHQSRRTFHEPHEFRVRAPIESGGAPSSLPEKSSAEHLSRSFLSLSLITYPFGACALEFRGRFKVPMHGIRVVGAFHEPQGRAGVPPAPPAKPTTPLSSRSRWRARGLAGTTAYIRPAPVHGPNACGKNESGRSMNLVARITPPADAAEDFLLFIEDGRV